MKANFIIQILKNITVNLFHASSSYSDHHCQQITLRFISLSHVDKTTLNASHHFVSCKCILYLIQRLKKTLLSPHLLVLGVLGHIYFDVNVVYL